MITRKYLSILPALVIVAFGASDCFAAGAHHAEGPLPGFGEFILSKKIYWINFLVYSAAVVFIARKLFVKAWASRRAAYEASINAGQKILAESESKLADARKLTASFPTDVAELKERISKDVAFECERIVQDASDKARKIKNQASQSVAVERRAALTKYQERLVELAVSRAKGKVVGMISPDVDNKLRDRVLGSVSGLVH